MLKQLENIDADMKLCQKQKEILAYLFVVLIAILFVLLIAIGDYHFLPSMWASFGVTVAGGIFLLIIKRLLGKPILDEEKLAKSIAKETAKIKKKSEKNQRRANIILRNLQNWMKKTAFSSISYYKGKSTTTTHKDPHLENLDKTIKVLKDHNAYILWEKGKKTSRTIKKRGLKAVQIFHEIVDEKLKNSPLKRSLEMPFPSEYHYRLFRVRQAIFEEVNGDHSVLEVVTNQISDKPTVLLEKKKGEIVTGWLWHSNVRLAYGEIQMLNQLEKMFDELKRNKKVKKQMGIFSKCKKNLDEKQSFSRFQEELDKLIADYNWNH